MNNTSAGPPSNAARVRGASQPSESSLKRKRGMFQKDLQRMMYGFGDVINVRCLSVSPVHLFVVFICPNPETVELVEDIVVDYVTDMLSTCVGAQSSGYCNQKGEALTEDFLFLIRKDSVKLNRCRELLSMHEDLKKARKAFDFDQEELAHMREYRLICNVQGQRISSPSSKSDCRLQPNNVLRGSLLHHNERYLPCHLVKQDELIVLINLKWKKDIWIDILN
ncbi:hypothetical protein MTR67_027371 [Solanum verrucosum]|uniref:Transcription initiation factor TFIID subunit 13 n=1 Tax=Solanum verrucosum TaxID=315347 RepID=A0AAF0R914_SOLVR|nr:hypothetical protein MTR67_027371 [Solanum verrucosum]